MGIGHGLQRGESFRRDNEERLRRVEIAHGFYKVRAIDIGDEAEDHGAFAVKLESHVSHHRTKIGPADANVDDVANAFAGMALPFAPTHAIGKVRHLVQNGMDLWDYVFTIHDYRCPLRSAEG